VCEGCLNPKYPTCACINQMPYTSCQVNIEGSESRIPRWLLASIAFPRGEKLPKLKKPSLRDQAHDWAKLPSSGIQTGDRDRLSLYRCFVCHDLIPVGERYYDTDHAGYRHEKCKPIIIVPKETEWRNTNFKPPEGNLGNAEYRWWIGHRIKESDFAMCRRCRTIVRSPEARLSHKADKQYFMNELPCTVILGIAYKMLERRQRCIVCSRETTNTRYGVFICCPYCETMWKFCQDTNLDLMIALSNVGKKNVTHEKYFFSN